MFKRLVNALFGLIGLIGFSSIVGYGLECGKDSYKKHKQSKEESKGRK